MVQWKGNALSGICVAELDHARAEIAISESARHYNDYSIKPRARGGKTFWNVSIFDTNEMRFDPSAIVDFTVGMVSIGEAKETAAMILEWADCALTQRKD